MSMIIMSLLFHQINMKKARKFFFLLFLLHTLYSQGYNEIIAFLHTFSLRFLKSSSSQQGSMTCIVLKYEHRFHLSQRFTKMIALVSEKSLDRKLGE